MLHFMSYRYAWECRVKRLLRRRMEAAPGFEPGNKGFADPRLTTWLCRLEGFVGRRVIAHAPRRFQPMKGRDPRHAKSKDLGFTNHTGTELLHRTTRYYRGSGT